MDLELNGKTVLVTGASAGLGLATAQALAAEGAKVVINSRDEGRLKMATDQIEKATGARPETAVGDVATAEGRTAAIDAAVEKLGRIDVLVSNAAGPHGGQFLDHDAEKFDSAYRLVLDSAIGLTRMVLPGMLKQKWGRLVYITSVGVLQPIDELILSNTFRTGVVGFCKTISNNYADRGVTANCVCPGYTDTDRLAELAGNLAERTGQSVAEVMKSFADRTPAGRLGRPEELASLITFIASDRAAYITGASIPVDGGYHRGLL